MRLCSTHAFKHLSMNERMLLVPIFRWTVTELKRFVTRENNFDASMEEIRKTVAVRSTYMKNR
jgi:hypothetical protein